MSNPFSSGDSPPQRYEPVSGSSRLSTGDRFSFDASSSSAPAYDAPHTTNSSSGKGKDRALDLSFGDESRDDMAWEPQSGSERMSRADSSDHSTTQQQRRESIHQHRRGGSRGGGRIELGSEDEGLEREERFAGTAGLAEDKRRLRAAWWRAAIINCLFILAWYCFSTLISIYNKFMFSQEPGHYNFPYPLFVTSCHMLVQWCLSAITLYFFRGLRPTSRPKIGDYASKIVPCGIATALDIGLSNLSLKTITLSFYTMCKSSSLVFVLLFAFLFKLEKPSWRLAGVIIIITSGVVLMVSTETKFDFGGMVEVLTASALGGLRWSLTQMLLDKENMGMGNPFATLFWLAPVMGATLAITSMAVEGWITIFSNEKFFGSFAKTITTIGVTIFPGLLAFSMNVTEFGLIQRSSVVTLSVAGIFKEVAVIFLSMFIFHDQLTPINVSGLVVTLFGIGLYNVFKYRQFTAGEGGGGHGHGGHGKKAPRAGESSGDEGAALRGNGRRSYEEVMGEADDGHSFLHGEGPDSPRARSAARRLGSTNNSAISLDDLSKHAPHHALGDGLSDEEDEEEGAGGDALSVRSPRSSGDRTIRQREGSISSAAPGAVGGGMGTKAPEGVSPPTTGSTGDEWDLILGGADDEEDALANNRKKLD